MELNTTSVSIKRAYATQLQHNLIDWFSKEQDHKWNSEEKGLVLGAFFYGYLTTQVLGGILAPIVGAGRLFGLSVLVSAVLSLMTPVMAYYGHIPLIVLRILLGISQVWTSNTLIMVISFQYSYLGIRELYYQLCTSSGVIGHRRWKRPNYWPFRTLVFRLEPLFQWELAGGFPIASAGLGYSTFSVLNQLI